MRIEIKHAYGIIEITVPENDYMKHIRKFLKRFGLEGLPVREILKTGRKVIIDMEGGRK